jgi:hypothetical protein
MQESIPQNMSFNFSSRNFRTIFESAFVHNAVTELLYVLVAAYGKVNSSFIVTRIQAL